MECADRGLILSIDGTKVATTIAMFGAMELGYEHLSFTVRIKDISFSPEHAARFNSLLLGYTDLMILYNLRMLLLLIGCRNDNSWHVRIWNKLGEVGRGCRPGSCYKSPSVIWAVAAVRL